MYSSNLTNFLAHAVDKESQQFRFSADDEIIRSCLIARDREVVNETVKSRIR
jgi:NAD/NADP transhydrogenase alpha subunit